MSYNFSMQNFKQKTSRGFTLAEVLLTLGIIGIVAAMTIPTVIKNINDVQFKSAYKKAYSSAVNAFNMVKSQEGEFNTLNSSTDGANACLNWDLFSSKFKKAKVCNNSDNAMCWSTAGESSNTGPASSARAFIDNSGAAWSMRGLCSGAGAWSVSWFVVDTNGFTMPNKYGQDRWVFSWVMSNTTYGTPLRISFINADYTGGSVVDVTVCPTGPCFYKTWLMK